MARSTTRKSWLRPSRVTPITTTSLRPLDGRKSAPKARAKLRPHDPEFWTIVNELSDPISVSGPEVDAIERYFGGVLDAVFGRPRNSWP